MHGGTHIVSTYNVVVVVEHRRGPCQIFGAPISVLYQTLIAWRSQECKHVNASFRSVFGTLRKEMMGRSADRHMV